MNRDLFDLYVETQLAPILEPGDVVIMDNLATHKSERTKAILREGGVVPVFAAIQPGPLSDREGILEAQSTPAPYRARTIDALWQAVGQICDLMTRMNAGTISKQQDMGSIKCKML